MGDWSVEPPAGIPGLMPPLRGPRSDAHAFGHVSTAYSAQGQRTSGMTFLVAASALERAEHLPKLAETNLQGIPRVPATWHAAQAVLAQAAPQMMPPLTEG